MLAADKGGQLAATGLKPGLKRPFAEELAT